MISAINIWVRLALALACAFGIAFAMTPPVKRFAERIGAIDRPDGERRMHDHPIPRMGGLAIFLGFIVTVLIFTEISEQVMGMLVGAIIIVAMGAIDDIVNLKPWVKLLGQFAAALVAVRCGIVFTTLSSLSAAGFTDIGWLAVPLTVLWIVGCTNAVNLIDGLDGLAAGVSAISSVTMLVVALFVAEPDIAIILAAVTGACIGFIPYNFNPAKIFMGDVGSQFLGYVLSTVSILGLFKLHALISFLVPVLALAVPLADTAFAFCRRILRGQSPFHADKGHFHHRLIAMGLSQKQAVAALYSVSALLGLLAVLLADDTVLTKIVCIVLAFIISLLAWLFIFRHNRRGGTSDSDKNSKPEQDSCPDGE